jgi:hypothetical protein
MKTMILTAILALTAQVAQHSAVPIKPDMIVTVAEAPVTIYVYGELALVAWGARVLGPLPWATLPGVPGQEQATAGISGLCVTATLPVGGTVTYPVTLSATAPTLGAAIQGVQAQIKTITEGGGALHPCPN